jgi:hypothetical protein
MRLWCLGAMALTWNLAHSDGGIYSQGRLNHSKAHEAYLEADWKPLARTLEKFLTDTKKRADRVDSAFAYKYLGVIYSANPETRPRGEARFRKLLTLDPSVDTVDFQSLYVSAEVLKLFRRLRDEYPRAVDGGAARAEIAGDPGGPADPGAAPGAVADPKKPAGRKKWLLVGAAGAAVAAGIGAILYVSNSGASESPATLVPVEL